MQLTLKKEGNFVRLSGPVIKKFNDSIRYGIRPQSHRKFDSDRSQWLIHWRWLPFVAQLSRWHFSAVDWSSLPDEWQMYAVGAEAPSTGPEQEIPTPESNPYEVLFVTENAPLEVVKAARDVLLHLHHPDHGGSDEITAVVVSAYKQIRRLRSQK